MSREAMKLALGAAEVLEKLFKQAEAINKGTISSVNVDCRIAVDDLRKGLNAAPALREALAEQPALKRALEALEFFKGLSLSMEEIERAEDAIIAVREALAEQPAQRKPLTDEEIGVMYNTHLKNGGPIQRFARAIEAAHGIKEKNA